VSAADPPIEDLARELWGEPNRALSTREELRYGSHGSKSVRPADRTWYDHEAGQGGGYLDLHQIARGEPPPPLEDQIAATYDYRDERGTLRFQVVRKIPKRFVQRAPDGEGGWRWSTKDIAKVPYRLPELLASPRDRPVYIVEGEKDADRLAAAGFVATTNPGGAGKWLTTMSPHLRGRRVVILPDNDDAGRSHADDVRRKLLGIAEDVRVLPLPHLPDKGDVSDWLANGGSPEALAAMAENTHAETHAPEPEAVPDDPLWHSDDAWSEAEIPRRAWVAPGYILRGSVTLVAGPGSAGKSMLFKAWSVASVLGATFHRFRPVAPLRVLSYNVEDDLHEERRRLSAALRGFGRVASDLGGNLRIVGPNQIGTLIERDAQTGRVTLTDAMLCLTQHIQNFRPDIVFLDPLVELHSSEENDNTGLRAVIAQFRALAIRHNLGIVIAHHTRKGAIAPGDPDIARGAGAIVGAARLVFTTCPMTDAEATELGMSPEARRHYFRLDGAKINYAPLLDAEWFERIPYPLDNGEDVAAIQPWNAPRDAVTADDIESIKSSVAKGFNGDAYAFRKGYPRSISNLCKLRGITTDAGIKQITEAMRAAGYAERPFRDIANRNLVKGIRCPNGEPAHVNWVEDVDQ